MVGKILNERYRIDNLVGSGGMAEVYKAFDLETQKVVAVKALKREFCEDPQYLRRFTREAQAMLSLSHKNIVSLYDVGSDGNIHYLVLEYIDGCTLRDYMDKHGALKPNIAVKVVCEVLDGLSHAHENGLVHRDVKPQNVMISSKNEIKLADFGIAKFAGSSTRTYEGTEALGSVYYISPEQAKGESVDAQTDLYSTGIMLYEMLTGKPPFSGDNAVQIALKHVNEEIKPPYQLNSQIPIALSDVILKAAAKDREVRYKYASDMKHDLLRALKHPRSRFARQDKPGEQSASENHDVKEPGWIRKHLGTIAIVACVTAVLAIFGAMLLISLSSDRRTGYKSVPNLIGKSVEEAIQSAEYKGFEIEIVATEESDGDADVILDQDPAAQEKAREGTVIKVIVSIPLETATVPQLYGLTVDEARALLQQNRLVLDEEYIDYVASEMPEGTVIGQLPLEGETAMVGDSVRITVSKQPETVTFTIPDLISTEDVYGAVELLRGEGFDNYRIHIVTDEDFSAWQAASSSQSGSADGGEEELGANSAGVHYTSNSPEADYRDMQVISQTPAAGSQVLYNTDLIDLYVYRSVRGEYKHDFSENINLKEGDNLVVTIITDIGEVVIYETVCAENIETVPFRGYYWEQGTYTCILYVNGVVNKELVREFVREG